MIREKYVQEEIDKFFAEREANQKTFADLANVTMAVERADTHERSNAVTAYQTDKYTRGVTWQQQ